MNAYLPGYLKDKNRRVIFNLMQQHKEMSRSDISKITHLSLPTVVKAVNKLLEMNIVEELEETAQQEGVGRKGHLLKFNADSYLAVGIEFEGTLAIIGLVDMDGNCLKKRICHIDLKLPLPDLSELLLIIDEFTEISKEMQSPIMGITIGFPGIINPERNSITRMPILGILEETPFEILFPHFCSSLQIPYYVENDVNVACAGEMFLRKSEESCENLLYTSLGTGYGAGIIINGKLWRGVNYKSGEIGDIIMGYNPLPNPSVPSDVRFENDVSLIAIEKLFGVDLRQEDTIDEKLRKEICDYLAPYLSRMIYNLANILDIDQCVLTGIVPKKLGNELLELTSERLNRALVESDRISISPAHDNAFFAGASVIVLKHRLKDLLEDLS